METQQANNKSVLDIKEKETIRKSIEAVLEENEETMIKNVSYTDYLKAKSEISLTDPEKEYLIKYLEGEHQIDITEPLFNSISNFSACIVGLNLVLKSLKEGSKMQKLVEDAELILPNFNSIYDRVSVTSRNYFINYANFNVEAFETIVGEENTPDKLTGNVIKFIMKQRSTNKIPLFHD